MESLQGHWDYMKIQTKSYKALVPFSQAALPLEAHAPKKISQENQNGLCTKMLTTACEA